MTRFDVLDNLVENGNGYSVSGFTDEAERIFTNTKHSLTKTIIQRITRSFMVNSKKIKNSEIQSLNAKLFNQSIPQNRIMIERERNQQKKR